MRLYKAAALAPVAALWMATAGCDPTAKSVSGGTEGQTSDRRSREHETCSRSADCIGDLRCFDGVCRRGKLSVLGDLYTALGDRAIAAGEAAQASEAYAQALSRYEQEKIDPPAQLLCALGGALTNEPGADKQKLERAARVLHRCLNGSPAGSFQRQRALTDLAALMGHGLDPATLTRREPADGYLTREVEEQPAAAAAATAAAPASGAAAAPKSDALQVSVKLEGRSRAGSYKKFIAYLEKTPDLRQALAPCWKAHFEKTKKDTMAVDVPLQYGHTWDEDETFMSTWIKLPEKKEATAEPTLAEAVTCAREALTPLFAAQGKKLREESRWQAVATFTVAPGKPAETTAAAAEPAEKVE
jgi:hypothetical protein